MALVAEIADFVVGVRVDRVIEARVRVIVLAFDSMTIDAKFTLSIHRVLWIPIIIIRNYYIELNYTQYPPQSIRYTRHPSLSHNQPKAISNYLK